jgi:hypothetical protein
MERDLITKIKTLIDNEPELEDANWFVNLLGEYVCVFTCDGTKYIVTIETLEREDD